MKNPYMQGLLAVGTWLACSSLTIAPGAPAQAGAPSAELAGAYDPRAVPEGLTACDWASIRAAYEAGRHEAFAVEGGHRARNPGQEWTTHFDGRGFTTTPDAGGWSWGLELVRYGWSGAERNVDVPRAVSAGGDRLVYEWDERLGEWYVNDLRGLEHGYTVEARPPHASGRLGLTLAIRGELEPRVSPNGRDVRFVDATGASVVDYAGLTVFDADGRTLAARWERVGSELYLSIDDEGARYPLTVDPIAQQAYLKPSNTDIGDVFGRSVAISGDTVVVGASGEGSGATGVNGDQSDNSESGSGAAYVFVRSGTTWTQQAYLKASNTDDGDWFGWAVAISGDTIVVGARGEESSAAGVDSDQSDNSVFGAGAAYVFARSGTAWSQEAYLKSSNPDNVDHFGNSVAVSGDTVVVGAFAEGSGPDGPGAVYVFVRDGAWSQEARLTASNANDGDWFGWSVAISGDTLAVGALGEDSSAAGVNGDEGDNSLNASGAAYVFVRSGTSWSQQAYLKASNRGHEDHFGSSVALFGDTVVVGAPREDSAATGVNSKFPSNAAGNSGAAYIFVRSGTAWSQEAYVKASNTGVNDRFGTSVAISDDTVAIAAPREDSSATGVNGDESDDTATNSGAVYVFLRNGTTWHQEAYLKASNTETEDYFGESISISGDTLIAGAAYDDSSATGVNGDQGDDSGINSGAAYVFDLAAPESFTPYCYGDGSGTACPCGNVGALRRGCAHSAGSGGRLRAIGSSSVGGTALVLEGTNLVPSTFGLFFQGSSALAGAPFGDGLRCAGGSIVRLQVRPTNAAGASTTTVDVAARGGVVAGDTRYYQLWFRDAAGSPCGSAFNLTHGLRVVWGP